MLALLQTPEKYMPTNNLKLFVTNDFDEKCWRHFPIFRYQHHQNKTYKSWMLILICVFSTSSSIHHFIWINYWQFDMQCNDIKTTCRSFCRAQQWDTRFPDNSNEAISLTYIRSSTLEWKFSNFCANLPFRWCTP